MSTVRRAHKSGNFTIIDNRAIRDSKLGISERGLLATLLSYPNDWVISIAHLCNSIPETGRTALTTSLKKLREKGYILRVDYRHKGRYGTEYTVFETTEDREAWMALNNVEDGQQFDYKPNFVLPDLSDPKDPGEPKPRKSRKEPPTPEEIEAEKVAKAAAVAEKQRLQAIKDEQKAERKRLEKEKREQDNAWRYELFGGQDRYTAFTKWYYGFYAPNSTLTNYASFFNIVLKDLAAGGEKYRSLVYQFELEEKKVAKAAEQERLNAHAAKVAEQANTPSSDSQPAQEPTDAPQAISVETLLSASDLEWLKSSQLRDNYLKDCLSELQRLKDFPVMHRQAISKYRKAQQAEDYYANQQVPV